MLTSNMDQALLESDIQEVILVQSMRSLIAGNHNAFQGDGLVSIIILLRLRSACMHHGLY